MKPISISVKQDSGLYDLYRLFAVIYTFMQWGFWWGVLNIFIPFAPIVDFIKYLTN